MSYDICIYENENHIGSLNWIRNPFGLCDFAEDNVGDGERSLWHVCNDNAYETSSQVDRPRFLRVVEEYWERLRALDVAFFHFRFKTYVALVSQHPTGMQLKNWTPDYEWDGDILKIDVERFRDETNFGWSDDMTSPLDYYKRWFESLLDLARLMQNPNVTIYITN